VLSSRSAPWSLGAKEILPAFNSSDLGLSSFEAEKRQLEFGRNEVAGYERRHWLHIFLSQFTNPLISVLILAAIVAYFLQEKVSSIVILAIVLMNALMGFFQEYKAELALRELRKYVTLKAKVLRDRQIAEIDSKELVPGDIVHLSIGDMVPADIRLLEADELSADESLLTGESVAVAKKVGAVSDGRMTPQNLRNMAFMGTSIASGSGYGIVTATGGQTFFGKSAAYLRKEMPESDFQKSIRKFGDFLLKVILVMTAFIFLTNAILGKGIVTSFLFALALAVGIIPEMLPIVMTLTLSRGALKMAKEKVVIKRLASVEDLGNIDTLCCDKTGTLTEGRISLSGYFDASGKIDEKLLLYGLVCNSSGRFGKLSHFENPMDKAIWAHRDAHKLASEAEKYAILSRNEFDFNRIRMSVLARNSGKNIFIVKGAPESIFRLASHAILNGKKARLQKNLLDAIKSRVAGYEKSGYRVLAVAEKQMLKKQATKADEKELVLLGFLLFLDPPKQTAKESIERLRKLKVDVKIITGDSPVITRKICADVGLEIAEGKVVTGDELEKLSPAEFEKYCEKYNVFARVTPEQKFKIVSALNKEGHIVGFLGDGINDAPALKAADVGISVDSAVGIAKDAASVILLRKSLRVVANGIVEGRKTFSNIIKYVFNTISANYGNMFTVAISSIFMKFIPLLPSQILLNNFFSDIPNLTISSDNVDEELLRKPKKWNIKLISRFMFYFGLISSLFDLALILPLLLIMKTDAGVFRTAWFIESALSEIIVVFAIRTKMSFLKSKPSRWLVISSMAAAALTVAITYTAFGERLFEFVKMPILILLFIGIILAAYFITAELAKRYFFRKFEV